jgi:hypothetical protein
MMNVSRLKVQPGYFIQFGYFWMGVLAIYWCGLFLTPPQRTGDAGIKFLVVAIGLSLAVSGWCWARALADGARVLDALQTPRTLWREWLRNALTSACVRWSVAVLAGTFALTLKNAAWPWSCAAFLYSAIQLVSVVASLSHYGVWHWAWPWCIALGICALAAFIGWHGLNQLLQASPVWHISIALGWPLLAASLAWRWRERPPQGVSMRRRRQFNLLHRCASYAKRYTPLNFAGQSHALRKNGLGIFAMMPMMIYSILIRTWLLKAQWGNQAGFLYIGTLGLLAIYASAMVVCKDLHWRRVLAPHGFPRGGLGWHIVLSTLTVVLAIALAFVVAIGLVLIICNWAGNDISPTLCLKIAAPYGVLPIECVLAFCVGVALRGTRRPALAYFVALFTLGAAGLVSFRIFKMKALLGFFTIGPTYVACLLLAIGIAIMLANRLWTTQRLLPFIVSGAHSGSDTFTGGCWFTWPGRRY